MVVLFFEDVWVLFGFVFLFRGKCNIFVMRNINLCKVIFF